MFSYRIEPIGVNFNYKPRLLPALKNASDRLELSISVFLYICMLAQIYVLLLTRLPILRIHLINALSFNCYMCYQMIHKLF